MRFSALFAVLAAVSSAQAALPRAIVSAPLSPVCAPAASVAAAPGAAAASPILLAPALSAAPTLAALPAPAAAAPSAAPAAARLAPVPAALPASVSAAPARDAASQAPRTIDALRAHAPLAASLAEGSSGSAEGSARALESNFNAAASLGEGAPSAPSSDEALPQTGSASDLSARLLRSVRLDDGGDPRRRAALQEAFSRMLQTPTARALADRFAADGVPAVVRFEPFEGSRLYEADGRKIFYAPRAFTEWKGDHVEVRMNLDYLGADEEFRLQDLPATLAHELLGHGLWYSRAARESALQAFHHHDLNETNARLVGWLVDFELDRRFEESGAWSYLQDPAGFLKRLKLRLPYYALTWSTEELAHPRETLEARAADAKAKRDDLRRQLSNHSSWNAVIDFFVRRGVVAEPKTRALRAYMADTAQSYEDEIRVMDELIAEVDATVGRMNAEPDRASERYLQWAATHPLFTDLRQEVDAHTRRLVEMVRQAPADSEGESASAAQAREDHWRGQLTFEQLVELYRRDRAKHPEHWQG